MPGPEPVFGPSFRPQANRDSSQNNMLRQASTGQISVATKEKLKRLNTHTFHGVCSGEKRVEDYYELGIEIGKGAFGVVREALDKATGTMLCCKSIPRASLTAEMFADIQIEAEIMMHLRGHPNVVEIMGLFQDDTHIHIVEEMCTGGDLYSELTKTPAHTEKDIAGIMRNVLTVLQHCHASGVIYRDCKPDNFLLSCKGPGAILKATDFGISKFLKHGETLDEFCGTPTYMAPEVFDVKYSYAVDVWSAGVTMFWIVCGEFPFRGKNKMELARKVCFEAPNMTGDVWEQVTPEAKDILKQMLEKDPAKRPTPTTLLEHKWFKKMKSAKTPPLGNIVLQRMRTFSHMPVFKQEVMRHIAHHLDDAYLVGLRSMFASMDHDQTGGLSMDELTKALAEQGVKVDNIEAKSIMASVDSDQNGQIDFLEFVSATLNVSILERKDLLQDAFNHYDSNQDGKITMSELEVVLQRSQLKPPRIAKILAEISRNTTGYIDFVHFRNLMLEATPGCKKAEDAWADKPVVYTRPLVPQPQFVSFGPSYKAQNPSSQSLSKQNSQELKKTYVWPKHADFGLPKGNDRSSKGSPTKGSPGMTKTGSFKDFLGLNRAGSSVLHRQGSKEQALLPGGSQGSRPGSRPGSREHTLQGQGSGEVLSLSTGSNGTGAIYSPHTSISKAATSHTVGSDRTVSGPYSGSTPVSGGVSRRSSDGLSLSRVASGGRALAQSIKGLFRSGFNGLGGSSRSTQSDGHSLSPRSSNPAGTQPAAPATPDPTCNLTH